MPAARGDIFNSALDIMATHQSVYSDDVAHTLGSDINSLVSTLPTNANPQVTPKLFQVFLIFKKVKMCAMGS